MRHPAIAVLLLLLLGWMRPAPAQDRSYACPMHASVRSAKPGRCPECGMELRAPAQSGQPPQGRADKPGLPDVPVLDQDGRSLRFYSDLVKGRTVAINFVFTTCTTICPPLAATFRKVQQQLGARATRDIHLISISVDPTVDVPARLKSFAAKFQAGPGWTFVTGGQQEIDRLLGALGFAVANKFEHSPMILVGNDGTGRWTRAYGLASAANLVRIITGIAGPESPPGGQAQIH